MKTTREAFHAILSAIRRAEGASHQKVEQLASHLPPAKIIGRVLATDIRANLSAPRQRLSAMDGYAVRRRDLRDLGTAPARLNIIGASHAGKPFHGVVTPLGAVKIFTGALVPKGADSIVIIENTEQQGDHVVIKEQPPLGHFIRPAGLDFKQEQLLVKKNTPITARVLSLIIASGHKKITVYKKPLVAILSTGDELLPINHHGVPAPHQIYATNSYSLAALVHGMGAEPLLLGIARDQPKQLARQLRRARHAHLVITTGGASIGDKDFVKEVISNPTYGLAGNINFWKIAMRPGKPIIFGRLFMGNNANSVRNDVADKIQGKKKTNHRPTFILGLPGNPASALLTALIFAAPMIQHWRGQKPRFFDDNASPMPLACDLPANGIRQDYMRVVVKNGAVEPMAIQDSSMLYYLHLADGVIIRPIGDTAKKRGDSVPFLSFNQFLFY